MWSRFHLLLNSSRWTHLPLCAQTSNTRCQQIPLRLCVNGVVSWSSIPNLLIPCPRGQHDMHNYLQLKACVVSACFWVNLFPMSSDLRLDFTIFPVLTNAVTFLSTGCSQFSSTDYYTDSSLSSTTVMYSINSPLLFCLLIYYHVVSFYALFSPMISISALYTYVHGDMAH